MPRHKINVLIVDDELQIAELMGRFLEGHPLIAKTAIAQNAIQASQKLQNQEFDLVLLDLLMPKKNGIDFITQNAKALRTAKLKYIIVSGCVREEDVISAVMHGVDKILVKPFTKAQLLEAVEDLFSNKRKNWWNKRY